MANYRMSITHLKLIPSYGYLTIQFPSTVNWALKNVVIYSGLPWTQQVQVVGQQIQITLAEKGYSSTMGPILLMVEVINPAVGDYAFTDFLVTSYFDS